MKCFDLVSSTLSHGHCSLNFTDSDQGYILYYCILLNELSYDLITKFPTSEIPYDQITL